MENKQGAARTQDSSIMKTDEQRPRSRGRSDLLTRRLKNRERQRRYRARKRLEAENKNSVVVVQETRVVQAEPKPQPNGNHSNFMTQPNGNHSNFMIQPNGNYSNFVTRIYCNRDWKKDARRAHVSKHQGMNGSIDPSEAAEPMQQREDHSGSETPRTVPGRRDWKAEARRKKN